MEIIKELYYKLSGQNSHLPLHLNLVLAISLFMNHICVFFELLVDLSVIQLNIINISARVNFFHCTSGKDVPLEGTVMFEVIRIAKTYRLKGLLCFKSHIIKRKKIFQSSQVFATMASSFWQRHVTECQMTLSDNKTSS